MVLKGAEQLGLDLNARAPLPDQPARNRIATDLSANLLVEAGAGSGKTTALVARMIGLVREGTAAVHQIAAVTFTRKAAGELLERFQKALERERLVAGIAPEESTRLEAALSEVDRAFMGTIHAFCAHLLRERPFDAGVDPGFAETTPAEAKLVSARFWSLHLERLSAEGASVLGELEDVGLSPADLRGMYDELRDYPDVEFSLEATAPPDPELLARVRADLDSLLDEAARLMPKDEPENQWDDLQRRMRSILYARRYGRWSDDRVLLDALTDLASRSSWKVTQYKWSPEGREGVLSPAAVALRDRINRLVAPASPARALLEQWWAHRYPGAMGFALGAARALAQHRRETGRLDFQDLLTLSAQLLRTHPAARRDLGERWRWLLVDKFQDTDPLQAEVLFLLASEPTSAETESGAQGDWTAAVPRPGGLFVIGDPKQSIYCFRRADIALYMRVRERFRSFGAVVELIANFRSAEPIAELVNTVFAPPEGFPWEANPLQAAFAPLSPQPRSTPPPRAGVFHYFVDAPDNRDAITIWDADALADWIAQRIREGRAPGDFLILTRNRHFLARYAAALEARNLPVQVSGAGIGVEEEVAELRLLLQALSDPDDSAKTVAVLIGLLFGVDRHIERTDEGRARGWFCVMRKEDRKSRTLARPHGWQAKEAAERAFQAAEDRRLLYVAATRAAEELVVARHPAKANKSPWQPFEPWLDEHGESLPLAAAPAPERERLDATAADMAAAGTAAAGDRRAAGTATYRFETVTGSRKRIEATDVEDSSPLPPLRPTSSGPGGYEWGSAVHGVLEAAAHGAPPERLRALGRSLLLEFDRPARAGEPTELDALMATVGAVRASGLWQRAQTARRRLAEVPFAMELESSTWMEGVVDLAFREPDGWVLADYKTDRGTDPEFRVRRVGYREQLRSYGGAWSRLTREPVKERVIFWVRSGEEERVDA